MTYSNLNVRSPSPSAPARSDYPSTTCVIVTYGRRFNLVKRTIAAVQESPDVIRVIVVDNGCELPLSESDFAPTPPVEIIRLPANLGSAGGFHVGVAAAQELTDTRFVLMLDDDNVGEPGFLKRLIALHEALGSNDLIGLCALRRGRGIYPTLLLKPGTVAIENNSFMNFHLASLPGKFVAKLRRRIGGRRSSPTASDQTFHLRRVETAPYGGLMLPIAAIKKIAPPDKDFVLYSDDHEYSLRLLDAGVSLYLTDVGCINDAEDSWDRPAKSARNALISSASPAWRIYYACRNRMLIEKRYVKNPLIYHINRLTYIGILACEALITRKSVSGLRTAMHPLLRGIADGDSRRLGLVAEYALPAGPSTSFAPVNQDDT